MRSTGRECSLVAVRRAAFFAVLVVSIGTSGCGDDGTMTTDPSKALAYMPAEPALLAILDTDVDGDQVQGFEGTVAEGTAADDVEDLIEEALEGAPVSYEDDVKPLLGGPLVAAVDDVTAISGGDGDVIAALVVDDTDKLRETLDKLPGAETITYVDDDGVLLVADSPDALSLARGREEGGEGLDPEAVTAAMEGLPEDALLKVYADLDGGVLELPELSDLTALPWFASLRTLGATVSFDDSRMLGDALVTTDGAKASDLPLIPTGEAPDIVEREGWISGANLDQSRATAFLLRTVRALFPDSDFVRDVATVERKRNIDFEREFLRQFNGPSQSLLNPDGNFAARSTVRDPEGLAETMEKIAPDLGRLVEDLQGLQSTGLGALLLFAPDAPAATSVLGSATVRVESIGDELYRMSGLIGPGPDAIVFGLIDDVFVVAEDEDAAQEIATAPAEAFDGPAGAAVVRASGVALQEAATDLLGIQGLGARLASEVEGSLAAETDGLRGSFVAQFGD
jgi:hypothetical protein